MKISEKQWRVGGAADLQKISIDLRDLKEAGNAILLGYEI
jgi:hypothetical protein